MGPSDPSICSLANLFGIRAPRFRPPSRLLRPVPGFPHMHHTPSRLGVLPGMDIQERGFRDSSRFCCIHPILGSRLVGGTFWRAFAEPYSAQKLLEQQTGHQTTRSNLAASETLSSVCLGSNGLCFRIASHASIWSRPPRTRLPGVEASLAPMERPSSELECCSPGAKPTDMLRSASRKAEKRSF